MPSVGRFTNELSESTAKTVAISILVFRSHMACIHRIAEQRDKIVQRNDGRLAYPIHFNLLF